MARGCVDRRLVRVIARVAGILAVLSVLSIAIYYASLFLPLGRLACMVALVAFGVAVLTRGARVRPSSDLKTAA